MGTEGYVFLWISHHALSLDLDCILLYGQIQPLWEVSLYLPASCLKLLSSQKDGNGNFPGRAPTVGVMSFNQFPHFLSFGSMLVGCGGKGEKRQVWVLMGGGKGEAEWPEWTYRFLDSNDGGRQPSGCRRGSALEMSLLGFRPFKSEVKRLWGSHREAWMLHLCPYIVCCALHFTWILESILHGICIYSVGLKRTRVCVM